VGSINELINDKMEQTVETSPELLTYSCVPRLLTVEIRLSVVTVG
jgi:hypothetical protein